MPRRPRMTIQPNARTMLLVNSGVISEHVDAAAAPTPTVHVEDGEVGERVAQHETDHRHPERNQQRVEQGASSSSRRSSTAT